MFTSLICFLVLCVTLNVKGYVADKRGVERGEHGYEFVNKRGGERGGFNDDLKFSNKRGVERGELYEESKHADELLDESKLAAKRGVVRGEFNDVNKRGVERGEYDDKLELLEQLFDDEDLKMLEQLLVSKRDNGDRQHGELEDEQHVEKRWPERG